MPAAASARDPNLDLVRAFAITTVMVSHLPHAFAHQKSLGHGVDIFFVLSGFLIGRIVLAQERRQLRPLRFWTDRWLRTLPAYYFVLIGGLAVGAVIGHPWRVEDFGGKLWEYLVFVQNYDAVSPRTPGVFAISWSLCVEEQFYLCLPLVLLAVRGRLPRLLLVAGVLLAAPLARWPGTANWERVWFMTHIRFDGIGFGLLIAFASEWKPSWLDRLRPWARPIAAAWLLLIAVRCWGWPEDLDYLTLLNLATALVLASCAGAPALPGAGSVWSRWGAALSYALYLVHERAYRVLHGFWNGTPLHSLPTALKWPFILVVTVLAALVLHVLVEKPGLALRARLRRRLDDRDDGHYPLSASGVSPRTGT